MAWGALIGVVLLVLSLPLALAVDVMVGGQLDRQLAYFPLCATIVGLGIFLVAMLGTSSTLELEVQPKGEALLLFTQRFAYFPWSRMQFNVDSRDKLEKRVKLINGLFGESAAVDIAMVCLGLVCCALGGVPGMIFLIIWLRASSGSEAIYRFQLVILSHETPVPIVLYQDRVENYFATRFGTPKTAEKIIQLLEAAVPEIQVQEREQ